MQTQVVTHRYGCSLKIANAVLCTSKKGKLPLVDADNRLLALLSRNDLKTHREYPHASKDASKRLLVGAAVGTREADRDRVAQLVAAGADVIVIDSSQGDSVFQLDMLRFVKQNFEVSRPRRAAGLG